MPEKRMECSRLLLEHLAWIKRQFLSGMIYSRNAGSLWRRMRGVEGVMKSINQSILAKGLGLGLLCWGFKGIQEEIPSEGSSTLQIMSESLPPGQITCPQLHPFHSLFGQDGQHFLTLPIAQTLLPVTFGYSFSSEAFVMMLYTDPWRSRQRRDACV